MPTPEGGNQYPATLEEAIAQGYEVPESADEEAMLHERYPEAFAPTTETRAGADEEAMLRKRYPEAFWPTLPTRRRVATAVGRIPGLPELPRISGAGRIIKGKYGKHGRTAGREISSAGAETITFLTDPNSHFGD
jgi:hypothetical protein